MSHSYSIVHITTIPISLEKLLLNQMIYLRNAGYDVSTISSPGREVATINAHGFPHFPVPMARSITPFADIVSLLKLYKIIKQQRFTIVHTHNPKPGLLGQLAARLAGTPIIVNTVHGYYFTNHTAWLNRQFYIFLEKIAASSSSKILYQSEEDITTTLNEGICPPAKIVHLGNGIDIDRFNKQAIDPGISAELRRSLKIDPETKVVGFVGRLVS